MIAVEFDDEANARLGIFSECSDPVFYREPAQAQALFFDALQLSLVFEAALKLRTKIVEELIPSHGHHANPRQGATSSYPQAPRRVSSGLPGCPINCS